MAVLGLRDALWAILVSTTVGLPQNLFNNSSPTLKNGPPNLSLNAQGVLRAGNNENCTKDTDCTIKDQICEWWHTCSCTEPKKYYSEKYERCFEARTLGQSCSIDDECIMGTFFTNCIGGVCTCSTALEEVNGKCEVKDVTVKWTLIVFPILGGVVLIAIVIFCIVRCRSGSPVRGFVMVRSSQPVPPVVSNYPPAFDNTMSPNQLNTYPPPAMYNDGNYQYPGMMQPGTGQVQNPQAMHLH